MLQEAMHNCGGYLQAWQELKRNRQAVWYRPNTTNYTCGAARIASESNLHEAVKSEIQSRLPKNAVAMPILFALRGIILPGVGKPATVKSFLSSGSRRRRDCQPGAGVMLASTKK
jgi:hypothetical protein